MPKVLPAFPHPVALSTCWASLEQALQTPRDLLSGLLTAPCPWPSGFYLWEIGRARPSPTFLFLLQKKKLSLEIEDGEEVLEDHVGEEEEVGEDAGEEREEDLPT